MAASDVSLGSQPRPSALDRFLSLFSRVQAGEGLSVVLLLANLFLVLGAYYTLKIVRDSMIVSDKSGAAAASYAAAVMAGVLIFLIPAYCRFGTKVNRIRLISWVTLFFITHLPIFYWLGSSGVKVGFAFYVWLGIFNNLVVAQSWAFANDLYTEEQGKRLFPLIGVGASVGAWVGSYVSQQVFRSKVFGPYPYMLMVVAAGVLAVCVLLSILVNKRESERQRERQKEKAKQPLGKEGGFQLILQNPYLRYIAILILLLNIVNTMGGFILNSFVEQQAAQAIGAGDALRNQRGAWAGAFFSDFYMWQNLISLFIQAFLVSRIFQWIGVRGAMFILPVLALGGYSVLALFPVLAIVRVTKLAENATDYSLQNTIRAALYLPTSREAKYKAKAAIDTFFVRTGDALQALLVYAGLSAGLAVSGFAAMNVGFTLVWLVVAGMIYREHKKLSKEG